MNSWHTPYVLAAVVGVFLISGCKSPQATATRDYPPKTADELVAIAEQSKLDYKTFSAKVSVDLKAPDRSNSFRATLRVNGDSAIWVSVSPAMGIEVFRLLCTVDSVKYIDKIKNQYFLGTYEKLNKLTNSELTLEALQDILVGNPLYFNPDLKYRSKNDDEGYQLSTRNTNKLRRIVGADRNEGVIIPTDTSEADVNERRLNRIQDKWEDEELIVRQYWLDYTHGKVVHSIFTDLASALYLSAVYSDFETIDNRLIPTKAVLELGNTKEQATFKLDYSRIKLNSSLNMPFSIPDKYEEVRN